MRLLTVEAGEELIQALQQRAAEAGVTDGAVVSLIGAISSCALNNMATADPGRDVESTHDHSYELSGSGEIIGGKVHLHVCLTGEGGTAIGGHLVWAKTDAFPVRAYVVPLSAPA